MADQRRPASRMSQPSRTPYKNTPVTPLGTSNTQLRHKRPHSARSAQHANNVRPNSARGILRRLAKITAPTTKRRVITPTSIVQDKENLIPRNSDKKDEDLKKPAFALNFEASIGEDDSEILIPPTPSALFQHSDDDIDPEPTLTFLQEKARFEDNNGSRIQMIPVPQSDSAIYEEDATEYEDENSTFLTERGRRAVSEEPRRVSRYSFGTIRMSDFGSELEIRRDSDRQKKLAELEAQDDYGYDDNDVDNNDLHIGGETENLRDLQRTPSIASDMEETTHMPIVADNTFHFDVGEESDNHEDQGEDANAHLRTTSAGRPVLADSIVELDDDQGIQVDEDGSVEATLQSTTTNRRQTLLESVIATAKPKARKKLKMNRKGNMVPSIPSSLIRWIANESQEKAGKRKIPLGKDHMKALEQATEWFFEQVGEDLEAYANHSKRKKRIDTDDVLLLMRRQRVLQRPGELQEMAQKWLPRETLKDLDFSGMC